MNEDKNYQLYVDVKKKLVQERLRQAKEYLATQFHGVSIIVYEDTEEILLTVVKFLILHFSCQLGVLKLVCPMTFLCHNSNM